MQVRLKRSVDDEVSDKKEFLVWIGKACDLGDQDAALFGVPTGYQLIDPHAVAEQVGRNMEQLDSVTGAPATPQTQQRTPAPRG